MPYTVPQNIDPNKIFLVNYSDLEGRWDPVFTLYNKHVKNEFEFPLVQLKDVLIKSPQYGTAECGIERKAETEPRYIRITDIDELGNLIDGLGATAEKLEEQYILNDGDILFARSGATVGKTYLHKTLPYQCFFAGYMIRIVVDKAKILPEYLFVYTQLQPYKDWVKAIQRAAAQPNINAEEYKSLPVPLPTIPIQQQIVNVYNAALSQRKKKLSESKVKLASIDQYLLGELGITLPSKTAYYEDFVCSEPTAVYHKVNEYELDQNNLLVQKGQIFTTMFSEVCGGRIDPLANNPTLKAIRKRLSGSSFVPLKQVVKESNEVTNDIIKSDIYVGLENIESNTGNYIVTKEKDTISNALRFKKGQILFPKLRPYLNKVYFAEFEGICSTEFHVLSAHNIDSRYLQYCLLSKLTLEQTTSLMTGNTLPRLQSSDIANIQIPAPSPSKQREIVDHISAIRAEAKALEQEANSILEQAKKKVEELILG